MPPGVVLCHESMVAGWHLRVELVLHGVGTLQIRVNGEPVGQPIIGGTLAQGRRRYRAQLKRLSRPVQSVLPI